MVKQTKRQNKRDSRSVKVDVPKLQWHIDRTSRSVADFAVKFLISEKTLYRMFNGERVRRSTVADIAEQLGVRCDELIESTPVTSSPEELTSPWAHPEWQVVVGSPVVYRAMSNGLIMQSTKVRHRILEGQYGRAKVYDISGMAETARSGVREALSRHSVIARLLEDSEFISHNLTLTVQRDGALWTCVDRWFEAESLTTLLFEQSLPAARRLSVVHDIAQACAQLHEHKILLRDLHPDHILVRASDGKCILADLELAKLLEVEATVSSQWQPNPYRAPEVAGGVNEPAADLFSCARLFVHVMSGMLPDYPIDVTTIESLFPDSTPAAHLSACLSPNWKRRPGSMKHFLSALESLEL